MNKDEFRVPFVSEIPVELEDEITHKAKLDIEIINLKSQKIRKKLSNPHSPSSKVADYLWDYFKSNYDRNISINKISEETGISKNVIPGILSDLSGLEGYPLRFIIAQGEDHKRIPGHVQLSTKNSEDTEDWLRSRRRSIAWQQNRFDQTEQTIKTTRVLKRRKIKIKAK